jgi:hypothetical protein
MQRFIQALRNLKPLPVAVAYFFTAASLVVVASGAFPAIGAPDWSLRLLFAVLAITAPFVIVLAWALSAGPPVGARVQRRPGDPIGSRRR